MYVSKQSKYPYQRLYVASVVTGPYTEHPLSGRNNHWVSKHGTNKVGPGLPIPLPRHFGRNAGPIVPWGDLLVRPTQWYV